MKEDFIWAQKYRPKTVAETILPQDLKSTFQSFVDNRDIPNLILSGRSGIGKTTIARAMLDEIDSDYTMINGSLNGGIDTLRVDISNFASTVSFSGGRKFVIIDEADNLNPSSTQPALRNFIEEYSKNCGFIMTCNFKNRIIEPLHSRCSVIDFSISKKDRKEMASQFYKRIVEILKLEGVEFDKKVVASVITQYFPDWRRVLNELQRYSSTGKIDSGILVSHTDSNFEDLINHLKGKNFTEMRKWVAENSDMDSKSLYRKLYDILPDKAKTTQNVADGILILADYQYKEAFVADSEINRVAALSTLMAELDWK